MTGRQMVRLYRRRGWSVKRVSKGSHYQMEKGSHRVTIPHHTTELPRWLEQRLLGIQEEVG